MSTNRPKGNVELVYAKPSSLESHDMSVTIADIVEFMKLETVSDWTFFSFLDIKDLSVFKFHRLLYAVLNEVKKAADANPEDAKERDHRFIIVHSSIGWLLRFSYNSWDRDGCRVENDDAYSMAVSIPFKIEEYIADLIRAGAELCDGFGTPYILKQP